MLNIQPSFTILRRVVDKKKTRRAKIIVIPIFPTRGIISFTKLGIGDAHVNYQNALAWNNTYVPISGSRATYIF